jgi:hypothetical protein
MPFASPQSLHASWIQMALLTIEFLLLFFIGPAVFAYTRHRIPRSRHCGL